MFSVLVLPEPDWPVTVHMPLACERSHGFHSSTWRPGSENANGTPLGEPQLVLEGLRDFRLRRVNGLRFRRGFDQVRHLPLEQDPALAFAIEILAERLQRDDVIIDGGNSHFKDDVRRAREVEAKGLHYVDVGTSGGVWGAERGYCLMIGGPQHAASRLTPIFRTLAPGQGSQPPSRGLDTTKTTAHEGFLYCGPSGAGHFVKMIHNGIEYGLMQSYAEGFDILRNAAAQTLPDNQRYDLNLAEIAELWRRGSVVSSWLLDLTAAALHEDPECAGFSGHVSDSGEGRWTALAAIEESVPAHVLTTALYERFASRGEAGFQDKLLSAMRFAFGGHVEKSAK